MLLNNKISVAKALIQKLQRYDLEWEWMAETEDGEFLMYEDVISILEELE